MNDPYFFGQHHGVHQKKQRRRKAVGLLLLLILAGSVVTAAVTISNRLKPQTSISQAAAVTRSIDYQDQTKNYRLDGFSIDLPANFKQLPRPDGTYQIYSWQRSQNGANGEQLDIYKDTIPANFAVNRVQIVAGEGDRLRVEGSVSDNCSTFTKGLTPVGGQAGVPAKWLDVDFWCDQFNRQRDVIGTSSADGINTLIMKNPYTGRTYKFFFVFTNQDVSPDYTTFINALQTFKLQ